MSLTQEQDKTITIYNPEAIMTTYNDLKSAKYIDATINFAEGLRRIKFKRTGNNRYSAYCPLHFDRKDSLRVYPNVAKVGGLKSQGAKGEAVPPLA
ncbi:MAG: hypothetical protein V1753_01765, partial [Pseudomonadota bacterium]